MEAVGRDQRRHVRAAKVDRPPATQRPGAAHQDKGFVGAGVLNDFLGTDQRATHLRRFSDQPEELEAAPMPRAAAVAAGAVAARHRDDAVLAAHGGQFLGGLGVLHGGEQAPGGGVVPGLFALAAPLADELAERLVEQQQGDAVFAAGVAGLFEDAHVAKAGDLIEQEENAAAHLTVGFIGGVKQGADDDAAERRGGLQGLQRDLHEDGQPPVRQIARAKRIAGDESGIGRGGEPAGILAGVAVDAGEGFGDEVLERAGEIAGEGAGGSGMDAREPLAHLGFRRDEDAAQLLQRLLLSGERGVPEHVREQAGDQALAALPKELGAGRDLAARLAANPVHRGLDVGLGIGRGDVDPVENVERTGGRIGRIEGHDPMAERASAVVLDHGADFAGGIEHHGGAAPGQHGGHADGGGLEAAGSAEDQGVGGARAAGIDQQWRGAALTPGGFVGRVEGAAGDPVLVDAVGLTDDDAAKGFVRPGKRRRASRMESQSAWPNCPTGRGSGAGRSAAVRWMVNAHPNIAVAMPTATAWRTPRSSAPRIFSGRRVADYGARRWYSGQPVARVVATERRQYRRSA